MTQPKNAPEQNTFDTRRMATQTKSLPNWDRNVDNFTGPARKQFPADILALLLSLVILLMVLSIGIYSMRDQLRTKIADLPALEDIIATFSLNKDIPIEPAAEKDAYSYLIDDKIDKLTTDPGTAPNQAFTMPVTSTEMGQGYEPEKRARTARTASYSAQSMQNILQITSSPSGALVSANGTLLGRTPYTWSNPNMYGDIRLSAEYGNFSTQNVTVFYTGGTESTHLLLSEKKPATNNKPGPAPMEKNDEAAGNSESTPVQRSLHPEYTMVNTNNDPIPQSSGNADTGTPDNLPEKSISTASLFISTIPARAEIYHNGSFIGKANSSPVKLTTGPQTLTFVKGDKEITRVITVNEGHNQPVVINF